MTDEEIGQAIMDFLIDFGLFHIDPKTIHPDFEAGVIVWNGNAQEQLGAFVKRLPKGDADANV
jgi:hypothetical protein